MVGQDLIVHVDREVVIRDAWALFITGQYDHLMSAMRPYMVAEHPWAWILLSLMADHVGCSDCALQLLTDYTKRHGPSVEISEALEESRAEIKRLFEGAPNTIRPGARVRYQDDKREADDLVREVTNEYCKE